MHRPWGGIGVIAHFVLGKVCPDVGSGEGCKCRKRQECK